MTIDRYRIGDNIPVYFEGIKVEGKITNIYINAGGRSVLVIDAENNGKTQKVYRTVSGIYMDSKPSLEFEEKFSKKFNQYAGYVHTWAKRKGFWNKEVNREDGTLIALIHSELSEMLEGLRNNNPPSKHCTDLSNAEEEAADCIIRLMDMAAKKQWNIGKAIVAKMKFNEGRPYKHQKEF